MDATRDELQFSSLYLMSFAGSLGYMTLLTLLPTTSPRRARPA